MCVKDKFIEMKVAFDSDCEWECKLECESGSESETESESN